MQRISALFLSGILICDPDPASEVLGSIREMPSLRVVAVVDITKNYISLYMTCVVSLYFCLHIFPPPIL